MRLHEDNITTIDSLWETNKTDHRQAVIYAVWTGICATGLPLNIYVVWLILRGAGNRIGPEFFTLNLALTDVLFLIGCLIKPFLSFYPEPLQQAVRFFYGFTVTGHNLFQTCICVERYLAVVHPVLFLKYKPLRYRLACSGVIWLMVLITCVAFLFIYNVIEIMWSILTVILLVVMLFCSLALLRGLCKPGPGEGERMGADQVKMKAFRIISVLTFAQIIIVMTILMTYCATDLELPLDVREILFEIIFLAMMSAYLIQPLLYLHTTGKLPCTTPR